MQLFGDLDNLSPVSISQWKVQLSANAVSSAVISLLVSAVLVTSGDSDLRLSWLTYLLSGLLILCTVFVPKFEFLKSSALAVFVIVFLGNGLSNYFSEPMPWFKMLHPLIWGVVAAAVAGLVSRLPTVPSYTAWNSLLAPLPLLAIAWFLGIPFGFEQASEFRGGDRFMGLSSEPAHFAQSVAIASGCLLFCESRNIGSCITGLVIGGVLLIAPKSLTAIPVILVGCVIAVTIEWVAGRRVLAVGLLAALSVGGIGVFVGGDVANRERLEGSILNALVESSSDQSAYARVGATIGCAQDWAQGNPWVPAGVPQTDAFGSDHSPSGDIHFDPLIIAIAAGVLGLLVFLWMCAVGIRSDWKIGICLVAAILMSGRVVAPQGAIALGLLQALGSRPRGVRRGLRCSRVSNDLFNEGTPCR